MTAPRTLAVWLAAASVAGLVPAAASGSPRDVETASYPWVQPPAWIPTVPAAPFVASTAYHWSQLH